EPVEDEPFAHILLVEPFPDDPDHHVVAHQLAARHDFARPLADFGAVVHSLAKDIARRDLRDPAGPRDLFGLSPFARARSTQHDQIQRHLSHWSSVFSPWSGVSVVADDSRLMTNDERPTTKPSGHECATSS